MKTRSCDKNLLDRQWPEEKSSVIIDQIEYKFESTWFSNRYACCIARSLPDNSKVFIKLPKPSESMRVGQNLKRESELLQYLEHDNIVKILGRGNSNIFNNGFSLVLEYIDGAELDKAVQKSSEAQIFNLLEQLLETCSYLKDREVTHGDIKPSNILVTNQNQVKLVDFEMACSGTQLRGASPMFLAPELLSNKICTPVYSTELYSLGITFYWLLTGRYPYTFGSINELKIKQQVLCPDVPTKLNNTIDPQWDEIIMHLIHKDPKKRIEIARFLEGH